MSSTIFQPLESDLITPYGSPITLPEDLYWSDRFTWTAHDQTIERTLDGAILIHSAAKVGGRDVTLTAAADRAWVSSATLALLVAEVEADRPQSVQLPGESAMACYWRHWDTPIEATPVFIGADYYFVTLRLLEA